VSHGDPGKFQKGACGRGGGQGGGTACPPNIDPQSGAEVADKRVDDAKNDGRNHETAGQ
jgi:hypothetical protein